MIPIDPMIIVGLSIILQVIAAILALCLVRVGGLQYSWLLISLAILLMTFRRVISLIRMWQGGEIHPPDLAAEVVALLISILMTTGLALFFPMFRSLRHAHDKLVWSQRILKEKDEWTNKTLDNIDCGIITINTRGQILSMNQRACRMFGYHTEEVVGKNIKMLMPEPYKSSCDEYLERYKQGAESTIIGTGREIIVQRKDGTVFPIDLSVGEVEIKGENFFIGTIRDLSDRSRMVEKETTILELKKEVNALAQELGRPYPYDSRFLVEKPKMVSKEKKQG
jgi:PAS domain S-box-containing protein